MRPLAAVVLAIVVVLPSPVPAQDVAPADHVILISIDGLRPDFYLDRHWPAPVLQRMAQQGAHARTVRGVFPSVTYPSHTTIVTGALPARHGIFYNTPFEADSQTGRWYWDYDAIRARTLWLAARDAGMTTASIFWPVTVGAPIDHNVPEVWSLDSDVTMVDMIRAASTEGLLDELEREATGRLVMYDSTGPIVGFDSSWWDPRRVAMAEYLIATARPNLMTIHLIATDAAQHGVGRSGARAREAVAGVDRAIGRLVETVERLGILDRVTFVVTGDHGFVDVDTRIAPNVWLAEAGLLEAGRDHGDWRARFHTAGGSAFLHLRETGDGETLGSVRRKLNELPPGITKLFQIVERDALDRIGADPRVPFALAGTQGVAFSSSTRGPAVRPGSGGSHGFLPDFHPDIATGLVMWGAGVREGAVIASMGLEDVAPLVASLLGIAFEVPDGILRAGALERSR